MPLIGSGSGKTFLYSTTTLADGSSPVRRRKFIAPTPQVTSFTSSPDREGFRDQVSKLRPATTKSMLPGPARLPPPMDGPKDDPSKISLIAERPACRSKVEELAGPGRGISFAHHDLPTTPDSYDVGYVSIDMLPDELLLGIFYLMCVGYDYKEECKPTWEILVHVCRRWRYVVFAAPRLLDLRLVCTAGTPVGMILDVWPVLPIVIRANDLRGENIIAALGHKDRVCGIYAKSFSWRGSEELWKVMQDPYPALTDLHLRSHDIISPDLPDSFLRGSAPRLRSLHLDNVAFLTLPELLLSSTGLVCLSLWCIDPPRSVYTNAIVNCLSSLTNLEKLQIDFRCCRRVGPRLRQSPLPCTVLPVLDSISFRGVIEDMEAFYARIEAPLLKDVHLQFWDPVIFDTLTLSTISPFISHKESFKALDQARMDLLMYTIEITLFSRNGTTGGTLLVLSFRCDASGWRLQSLTQGRRPFSPLSPLPNFDHLNDRGNKARYTPSWAYCKENARWLELLRVFASVETLYLPSEIAAFVAPALQELAAGGVVTQVLPTLQNLFIDIEKTWSSRPPHQALGEFVAAREVSGYPVSLHCWA